uniref:Retrovirus-related Pol polyprotein from transposon TNT 1-94-like beta-barrel domain-containing protein n=1 Tax=Cannabis sativa TaxID=3483 RepID=A0A803QAF2_CANSA
MCDGIKRTIKNVRYVPKLKRNLFFIGELAASDCTIKIEESLRVIKGSLIVMKGDIKNGIYVLNAKAVLGTENVAVNEKGSDKTRMWHLRLSHVSERGLIELEKQGTC